MKEFFKRIQHDTPLFFKRLRNVGLSLSATGTAVATIHGIPEVLKNHASTAIWVGMVIAAVSQLTVSDPEQLKK
jgi:hypothetical protein